MSNIINLRQARKAKARVRKAGEADANRAKFGRTKAERTVAEQDAGRLAKIIDGAFRGDQDDRD